MKRNFFKITFSALLLASTAHAIAETQDQSATLAVTGKVSNASAACQVTLSNNVITLNSTSGSLIEQGQNATAPTPLSSPFQLRVRLTLRNAVKKFTTEMLPLNLPAALTMLTVMFFRILTQVEMPPLV